MAGSSNKAGTFGKICQFMRPYRGKLIGLVALTALLSIIAMLPPLLTQSPDLTLTPKMALVPIANVALMFREAIAGVYRWPMIGLVLAVQVAAVALCLVLARKVLAFEDVLIGSYSGSFGKFVQERLLKRGAAAARGAS